MGFLAVCVCVRACVRACVCTAHSDFQHSTIDQAHAQLHTDLVKLLAIHTKQNLPALLQQIS